MTITCEEFHKFSERPGGLLSLTNAELGTVFRHVAECKLCYDFVERAANDAKASNPEAYARGARAGLIAGLRYHQAKSTDPEL